MWRVEFALQSVEDPSLIADGRGCLGRFGTGWLAGDEHPDELLLAGLGAAARLFPDLEEALREPAPAAVTLDNAGALRFLRETGPLLAGAGFGVLLPDWARKARLGLKLTTGSTRPARHRPGDPLRPGGNRRVRSTWQWATTCFPLVNWPSSARLRCRWSRSVANG